MNALLKISLFVGGDFLLLFAFVAFVLTAVDIVNQEGTAAEGFWGPYEKRGKWR
jgi:hypothetical protein